MKKKYFLIHLLIVIGFLSSMASCSKNDDDNKGIVPVAAFDVSSTNIIKGENVQFTDQSTNSPTSWDWDFGDSGTSIDQNPSYTYTTAGTYSVSLTVANASGTDTESKSSFITVSPGSSSTVTDIDGNVYTTVNIDKQTWMVENLKTTTYNDGTTIPKVTDDDNWGNLETGAYCWYDNDETSYKGTYGALYNWYTVETEKLCPTGWHVPSNIEWLTLTNYLGGLDVAGGKLKETGTSHWNPPNTGATNESGFTALPSGYRNLSVAFYNIKNNGSYWSSTESDDISKAYGRGLTKSQAALSYYISNKETGYSIRCLRD